MRPRVHPFDWLLNDSLRLFCQDLNLWTPHARNLGSALDEESRASWLRAEEIVELLMPGPRYRKGKLPWASALQQAIALYSQHFGKDASAFLTIFINPNPLRPVARLMASELMTVSIPAGQIKLEKVLALKLWELMFLHHGYERLRRCRGCKNFFVAWGKRTLAQFCTASCKNRYWTRPLRRQGKPLLSGKGGDQWKKS